MPAFLVPLHEHNDCHAPAGQPTGGQFCSDPKPTKPLRDLRKKRKGTVLLLDKPLSAADEVEILGKVGEADRLAKTMTDALPGDFVVRLMRGATGVRVLLRAERQGIYVSRTFRKVGDDLEAYHSTFELPPALTKGGIAKDLLSAVLPEYDRLGVDRIKAAANLDVGGYAWARFGFKADDPGGMARELRSRIASGLTRLHPEEREVLKGLVNKHSQDPKLPWIIADAHYNGRKIGKEVLLGMGWEAVFDMHDREARERMNRYLAQ